MSGATTPLHVVPPPTTLDPEVRERAARRRFTAEYKLQVLREADQCAGVGEVGAMLRREGLYSSHLTTWRRQREHGALVALAPKKRGRATVAVSPLARRVAELERDKARLERRLKQAEAINAGPGPRIQQATGPQREGKRLSGSRIDDLEGGCYLDIPETEAAVVNLATLTSGVRQ